MGAQFPKGEEPITRSIMNIGDVSSPLKRPLMHVSIRIKGHLDPSWQDYLEGLEIVQEADGTSRLSGMLQDQAALYGVLNMMSHLSLTLLSLESIERAQKEG